MGPLILDFKCARGDTTDLLFFLVYFTILVTSSELEGTVCRPGCDLGFCHNSLGSASKVLWINFQW